MKHTEYIIPIGEDAQDYDEMFIGVIRRQPELVRCKDCNYWGCEDSKSTGECFLLSMRTLDICFCCWAERIKKND